MLACQKTRKVGGPLALNPSKMFWLLLASLINIQQSDCEPNKYETFILKNSKNQDTENKKQNIWIKYYHTYLHCFS